MSCLTSSPTLKMEACHTPRGESWEEREVRAGGGGGGGGGGERELHYIHVDKANEYQYQLHYTVGLIQ